MYVHTLVGGAVGAALEAVARLSVLVHLVVDGVLDEIHDCEMFVLWWWSVVVWIVVVKFLEVYRREVSEFDMDRNLTQNTEICRSICILLRFLHYMRLSH